MEQDNETLWHRSRECHWILSVRLHGWSQIRQAIGEMFDTLRARARQVRICRSAEDLEKILAQLKSTQDPENRRLLLRAMRRLLKEADRILG